jgi:hypothetical protein
MTADCMAASYVWQLFVILTLNRPVRFRLRAVTGWTTAGEIGWRRAYAVSPSMSTFLVRAASRK